MLSFPRHVFICLHAVLVVAGWVDSLFAHKMEVKATANSAPASAAAEPEMIPVQIEAWYEYGDPADAEWWIIDPAGREVARGRLDPETGQATLMLRIAMAGDYKITVDDGAGHREAVLLHLDPHLLDFSPVGVQSPQRNRWLMAVIGLGLIAALTAAARRLSRPSNPPEREIER